MDVINLYYVVKIIEHFAVWLLLLTGLIVCIASVYNDNKK